MQRIQRVAAISFIVLSAYVIMTAIEMQYYTRLGPGPGFFPFWLGVIMGVLSIVWIVQLSWQPGTSTDIPFLPARAGIRQILYIMLALSATSVMNIIGFQMTMFLFMIFLLRVVGKTSLLTMFIIALMSSVGVFHLFGKYLDVHLPSSSLAMLAALGL